MNYEESLKLSKEIQKKYLDEYEVDCDDMGFYRVSRSLEDILEEDYPTLSDEEYDKLLTLVNDEA